MKTIITAIVSTLFLAACHQGMVPSQTPVVNTEITRHDTIKMLLGHTSPSTFAKEPYSQWWLKNQDAYQPNDTAIKTLQPLLANTSIEIFLGTWCGDSKREVPRMMKVLQVAGYPADSIKIIGVDNNNEAYKQSPQHEEAGKNIFRVPTFIVYKNNKEQARIIEYPVVSLEKDLVVILKKESYTPNYNAVNYWIKKTGKNQSLLSNSKMERLATSIKPLTTAPGLFNSYGYLVMGQKNTIGAINIFKLNTLLYPNDANTFDSLGEAYMHHGNKAEAIANYEKVLQMEPGNKNAIEMLQKLKG